MRTDWTDSWQQQAETLGFLTEAEMLKHLYLQQDFSLRELSIVLGYSAWSVRRRLRLLGIPMKQRGGPLNRLGRRRLKHLTDDELHQPTPPQVAAMNDVHVSTVFAEKRLRENKKETANGILSNRTDQLCEETGDQLLPMPDDVGSMANEE